MTQTDVFGAYVRTRLEEWGREFALHRDCEYLGHMSKNLLQILIDHKGELPRGGGYKPLEVSAKAMQIEDIVADLARSNLVQACVLRAYYCGTGRRKTERWFTANQLIAYTGGRPVSERHYSTLHGLAVAHVRGFLTGLAQADGVEQKAA